jgi:hypothetical protein
MFFRNKKKIQLLVQLILLLLVIYFFYKQVSKININSLKNVSVSNYTFFTFALILFPLNWFLEFLKWNLCVNIIDSDKNTSFKLKSFFAGILSGFVTPSLMGNFIGRMYYFDRKMRTNVVLLTLVSNASQFLSSMLFGLFSLCLLTFPFVNFHSYELIIKLLSVLLILVIIYYYFVFEKVNSPILKKRWIIRFYNLIRQNSSIKKNFLFLSLTRHFVFSSQFVLILMSFGVEFEPIIFLLIWSVYFWSTLIPSFWFGKLLIRESVALWIFSLYNFPLDIILISSITLWVMNQFLIAIFSIPFFKLKLYDN